MRFRTRSRIGTQPVGYEKRSNVNSASAQLGANTKCQGDESTGAAVRSLERDGDVLPLLLGWALGELAFDSGDYLGELAVVERPYEHQAGM
jgi:hypothetical protein